MDVGLSAQTLTVLLLATLRTTTWVYLAPPFSTSGLPRAVKLMVAVALALVVTPSITTHIPNPDDVPALIGSATVQVVVGAALGFCTKIVFVAVEAAGSLIDLLGGFSLAFAFDPLGATSTSVFGRFYTMLGTTLILVTPAHEYIVLGFLRTFSAVPLDGGFDMARLSASLTHAFTGMFVGALQIAGPLILILFLADLGLGLLNKAAPQLNAFSLSFPIKIGLTLGLVGLTFNLLPDTVRALGHTAATLVSTVAG